jgi:hypothetical protein
MDELSGAMLLIFNYSDKDYIEIFLATHKHFITSVELLRLLMD